VKHFHLWRRIASVQVAAESPEIPITLESLKAFIEQNEIVGEIDEELGRILGVGPRSGFSSGQLSSMVDLVKYASINTVQELDSLLTKASPAIKEFVTRCAPIWGYAQVLDATYRRGFCIRKLADLLISAGGEDRYNSYFESLGICVDHRHDLRAQVAIAKEIVETHRLCY
jgi:hypothetical protein